MGNENSRVSDDLGRTIGGRSGRMRSESALYELGELTRGQRDAVRAAKGLLADFAKADAAPDRVHGASKARRFAPSFLPSFDAHRDNHAVLIDGRRGTGKTAALLRVLQDLDEWAKETPPRIIPVSLIDLHPIPETTNLIVHIVGELRRVMHPHTTRGVEHRDHAAKHLLPRATRPDPGRAEELWERFAACAIAGWDPHVGTRVAQTDVETYVEELKTAERQRRDLRACFREFIDQVVEDFRAMYLPADDRPPFFVFALDDADMIPQRGPELLELVRMLWHPRVGFLLTGDSDLFRFQLCQNFAQRLRLKDGASTSAEVYARAEQLAFDVYNKEIPPSHRLALDDVSPDEALRETESLKLQRLFDDVWAKPEDPSSSARAPKPSPSHEPGAPAPLRISEITVGALLRACPFIQAGLPVTLRSLVDLQLFASVNVLRNEEIDRQKLPVAERRRALSNLLRSMWEEVISRPEADNVFSRSQLASMLAVRSDDGGLDLRLPADQPLLPVLPSPTAMPSESLEDGDRRVALFARRIHLLGASGKNRRSTEKNAFSVELERGLAATIALTACIASLSEENDWSAPASSLIGLEPLAVYSDLALTTARGSRLSKQSLGWPMIEGINLLELAVFSMFWNFSLIQHDMPIIPDNASDAAQRRARRDDGYPIRVGDDARAELLAKTFITCILRTVLPSRFSDLPLGASPLEWGELARFVVELSRFPSSVDHTRQAGILWARERAILLSAPEAGLPWQVAEKWLDALIAARFGKAPPPAWIEEVREARNQAIFGFVFDRGPHPGESNAPPVVEDIIGEIDRNIGTIEGNRHPWFKYHENARSSLGKPSAPPRPPYLGDADGKRLVLQLQRVPGLTRVDDILEFAKDLPIDFASLANEIEDRRPAELTPERVLDLLWTTARRASSLALPELDVVSSGIVAVEHPESDEEIRLDLARATIELRFLHDIEFQTSSNVPLPTWLEELFQWIDDQRPHDQSWKMVRLMTERPMVLVHHPALGGDMVAWPRLSLRSFRELKHLQQTWYFVASEVSNALTSIHERGGSVTVSLAHRFIRAQFAARAGIVDPSTELDTINDVRRFGRLTRNLMRDAERQIARDDDRADCIEWLRDLTVLAAPEYGLPARFANALLTESLKGLPAAERDGLVARLRRLRREALNGENDESDDQLAAAIDAAESSAKFDWIRKIEGAAPLAEKK